MFHNNNSSCRLKSDGRIPQTIRVTVRKYSPGQWKRESRQCSLPMGTLKTSDAGNEIKYIIVDYMPLKKDINLVVHKI